DRVAVTVSATPTENECSAGGQRKSSQGFRGKRIFHGGFLPLLMLSLSYEVQAPQLAAPGTSIVTTKKEGVTPLNRGDVSVSADFRAYGTDQYAFRAQAPTGTCSPVCQESGNETPSTPGAAPVRNIPVTAAGVLHAGGSNVREVPCPIRSAVAGVSPRKALSSGRYHSTRHQILHSSPGSRRFPLRKTRACCETRNLSRSPA